MTQFVKEERRNAIAIEGPASLSPSSDDRSLEGIMNRAFTSRGK